VTFLLIVLLVIIAVLAVRVYLLTSNTKAEITIGEYLSTVVIKEAKLISTRVNIERDIMIDVSDIMKKKVTLRFHGTALFTTDLEQFGIEDIISDDENKQVTIYIPPTQLEIYLEDEKTTIQEIERGPFVFSIKVSHEEYKKATATITQEMLQNIKDDVDIQKESEENAKAVFKELIEKILSVSEFNDYEIIVEFRNDEISTE